MSTLTEIMTVLNDENLRSIDEVDVLVDNIAGSSHLDIEEKLRLIHNIAGGFTKIVHANQTPENAEMNDEVLGRVAAMILRTEMIATVMALDSAERTLLKTTWETITDTARAAYWGFLSLFSRRYA